MPPVDPMSRTFGIELEFANSRMGDEVAYALNSAGLSRSSTMHQYHCACEYCRYEFGHEGNWLKVQSDSSCGGEVISSPLSWDGTPNPWTLMQELATIFKDLDIEVDQRCGMHVHVFARDLTARMLGRLYELTEHHEATMFRLACGRQARHRGYGNGFNYCRPLSAFNNKLELKALQKAKTAAVRDSAVAKMKYVAANLMPLDNLGTVEFRLFEGTRSARRMRLYSVISLALVERARKPRGPMGKPLHLGEAGDDTYLEAFLEDLEHGAPELMNMPEVKADAHWQWTNAPARWQPPQMWSPLPHYDIDGIRTDDPERAVYCQDSHGNSIPLEGTEWRPPGRLSYRNTDFDGYVSIQPRWDDDEPVPGWGYDDEDDEPDSEPSPAPLIDEVRLRSNIAYAEVVERLRNERSENRAPRRS